MKKLLIFFLWGIWHLIGTTALAQTVSGGIDTVKNYLSMQSHYGSAKSTQISEWYNYAFRLNQSKGFTLPYLYEYLFPDSSVKMPWSSDNALHYVTAHSYGQVLDPGSAVFPNPIDPSISYSVDSVGFWYQYFRYQNSAPDTLVVQVFNNDRIHFGRWSGAVDTPYAYVLYDTTLRRSPNPTFEFKGLLTNLDTTTTNYKFLSIPINPPIVLPAGGKVAATITYYPGNPHNFGDTIYPFTIPPPVNLINGFMINHTKDVTRTFELNIFNNGLAAWNDERYNKSSIGWNGKYHSECAWWTEYDNMNMAFKITTLSLSTQQPEGKLNSLKIFPNPASSELNIYYNGISKFNFNIYNSFGQLVKKGISESELTTININSFTDGIYCIEFSNNGKTKRQRFIIEK